MKQVIFVCLLSLSVCLSQPSTPTEASPQTPTAVTEKQQNSNATETKAADPKQPEHQAAAANEAVTKPTVVVVPEIDTSPKANVTQTQNATATNETSSKTTDNKAANKSNSSTDKPAETVKPESNGKNETKTPATPAPATNGTNADGKDGKKNETTTPKGENVSPTAAPVEAKTRAFDGPSFIGGIILTLGMLAIGFMGFKYYKNQTERNYHTL